MKLRYVLMFAGVALLQATSALRAQDVAAAARANRVTHPSTVSASPTEGFDALRTCVSDNTTGKDRKDLAKWVFFAMAAHPEIKQYADPKVADAADESAKSMAALVTRLLTDSCVKEVRAVMSTGQGAQAVQLAFRTLGELAMQELMTDKSVQDTMSAFGRYVDQSHLNQVLAAK